MTTEDSKYPPDLLRQWAQHALAARDRGDVRWILLVLQLSLRTGMYPDTVTTNIETLAEKP